MEWYEDRESVWDEDGAREREYRVGLCGRGNGL